MLIRAGFKILSCDVEMTKCVNDKIRRCYSDDPVTTRFSSCFLTFLHKTKIKEENNFSYFLL